MIKGKRSGTYAMVVIELHITQFSDWANPLAAEDSYVIYTLRFSDPCYYVSSRDNRRCRIYVISEICSYLCLII
jgi:hypothetical protein